MHPCTPYTYIIYSILVKLGHFTKILLSGKVSFFILPLLLVLEHFAKIFLFCKVLCFIEFLGKMSTFEIKKTVETKKNHIFYRKNSLGKISTSEIGILSKSKKIDILPKISILVKSQLLKLRNCRNRKIIFYKKSIFVKCQGF